MTKARPPAPARNRWDYEQMEETAIELRHVLGDSKESQIPELEVYNRASWLLSSAAYTIPAMRRQLVETRHLRIAADKRVKLLEEILRDHGIDIPPAE